MKHTVIKAIAFSAVCIVGWQIGGVIPAHTITLFGGFLFGAFVGIPAMLIIATRAQTVRHDHYIHKQAETPVQTQKQPGLIVARPTHYKVIASRRALAIVERNRIEVKQ